MRLDRSITLNLVQPLRRTLNVLRPLNSYPPTLHYRALPILMYHSISDDPETGVSPYYRTATSPAVFRQHMTLLKSEGYQGVDLSTGLAWLKSSALRTETLNPQSSTDNSHPPNRPVVLTFDDGFHDFYTSGFPILQKFGFTATMFLPTAFISNSGVRRSFRGKECLTWDEIRELRVAGMEFGSHTISHPKLVDLEWAEIESELSNSKSEIERQLDAPVTSFAYPYAFPQAHRAFGDAFRDRLRQSGYQTCVTTTIGRAHTHDDPYRLCRLPANSNDDDRLLRGKIEGAYDWLAGPQAVIKKLMASFRQNGVGRARPPQLL